MKIICISDTHGHHDKLVLPPGDVLVATGDISMRGHYQEIEDFLSWMFKQEHTHKILIAGNHDFLFQDSPAKAQELLDKYSDIIYLQDTGVEIDGINFWGSPWQPWFGGWAFNLHVGYLTEKWSKIPGDTDVLLTHGPPWEILDVNSHGENCGCLELSRELERIRPRVHVFGHIHEAAGQKKIGDTIYVNASYCGIPYYDVNSTIQEVEI